MSGDESSAGGLSGRQAAAAFAAFAFAYFFSALLRAITATLAPVFNRELDLSAGQLGLLAGAYFLGFSAMQLPLGQSLDRFGPKRTLIALLLVAVAGTAAFALAGNLGQMLAARLVIGVGVSACLMAPLTFFRRRYSAAAQLRANSWMLMTGSLGMLASTLPVQWLMPVLGWRGLFAGTAGLLLLASVLVVVMVRADDPIVHTPSTAAAGYSALFASPAFRRLAPSGFFSYGGMVAMQSLWIGPWLTQVGHRSAAEAAAGLFVVNGSMLLAFLGWGVAMPKLIGAGWAPERLIRCGWPLGVGWLGIIIWRGEAAGPLDWALWCVLTSVVSLGQPAVAQAFASEAAGRALTAFNLVIFLGVFTVQWVLGLVIDALAAMGWTAQASYRAAFAAYLATCAASFLSIYRHDPPAPARR